MSIRWRSPAPSVNTCKFSSHPDPENRPEELHHDFGKQTVGFVRGATGPVGQTLAIWSKNGKSVWVGWLTKKFTDGYGDGYEFKVYCVRYVRDESQPETQVTATVIDPATPTQPSNPFDAVPNPSDVP